jgi:hypothetical protein
MTGVPYTSHVSITDARRDLLATVADHLADGTPLHPLVALDAALAFRQLVDDHDRSKDAYQAARAASDRMGWH